MKWFIKYRRDASKQTYAKRLFERLQKYCSTDTPEKYRKKGEQWGCGQFEITISTDETYRGEIKCLTCPQGACSTLEGLPIKLEFAWFARKRVAQKYSGTFELTWEWELLPTNAFTFIIRWFYQNKTYEEEGVHYPKRLFFITNCGEEGHFTQRGDPENLRLKYYLEDPLKRS